MHYFKEYFKFPPPGWLILSFPHQRLFWPLLIAVIFFAQFLFHPPETQAQTPPLRINTGVVAPYVTPERDGFLDLLVAEIFRRMQLEAGINSYAGASARSLQMSNSGEDDGEALRIGSLNKKYTNLIPVPESILENHFVAYSAKGKFPTEGWDSLKPYVVGFINGWQVFKRNVKDTKGLITVHNPKQLFEMLDLGRLDVALYEKWQGLALLRKMGIQVHVLDPPLVRVQMYMYLHKKHQKLVKPAAEALRGIKSDGTYQQIFDLKLTSLLH